MVASWEFEIDAPIHRVWSGASDTDLFNRVAGLGYTFEERVGPDGVVHRAGSVKRFGLTIDWEEQPFRIEAPQLWVNTRVYRRGPLTKSVVTCTLTALEADRTQLRFEVALTPRNWWSKPAVLLDLNLNLKRTMERSLTRLVASIEQQQPLEKMAALPTPVAARVRERLADLEPRPAAEALREALESGSMVELDRLRPLRFARNTGSDPEATVQLFLEAVRRGLLMLRWELLCPGCRAPKASETRLELGRQQHCSSCNIVYDGSFADSVEVVFRPDTEIRDFSVPVDCLLSPARTPHVVAQVELRAQGLVETHLDLAPGAYRLSTGPLDPGASLEVREGLSSDRATVDVRATGIFPPILRARPGKVRLFLRSCRDDTVWVRLEARERSPDVLTAGRLFELPDATDLLPADAVHPGLQVSSRRSAVLVEEAVSRETKIADTLGALEANGVQILLFDTFAEALKHAEKRAVAGAALGLALGTVVTLTQGDDMMPSGSTVDAALAAARAVGEGRAGLAIGALKLDEVQRALEDAALDLGERSGHIIPLYFRAVGQAYTDALVGEPSSAVFERIGPYLIGEELGRGGMGRVVEAIDAEGNRRVMKLLLPHLASKPENAQRFFTEAMLTSRVHHQNVVRVYDYGEIEGRMYLVMERLEGEELEAAALPLAPERTAEIGEAVLAGLQAAHEIGIVHRDIKPGNVFLLASGGLKIIDFGIAVAIDKSDSDEVMTVLGTPRYMSPEQVERDPIDARSDLYSVGLMLYECLAGDIPFTARSTLALAMARVVQEPAPLLSRASVSPELAAVIMRAIELDPPRRFDSAAAMREALLEL